MPDKSVELDFHGVRVALRSRADAVLAELSRDFAYFRAPLGDGKADIALDLRPCHPPPGRAPRLAHWRWRSARVTQQGTSRLIDYEGRALIEYDLSSERGVLHCESPALLHELSYLTALSRVGERLDRLGLHRVHALGFSFRGKGGLLLLPSGGGKSRLGLELIRREGFELLSDDIPLLKGKEISAFPLGIGLRGKDGDGIPRRFIRPFLRRRFGLKHVVDSRYFQDKIRPSAPLAWILVGRRNGAQKARVEACCRARAAAAMTTGMVLGVGTPQILELMRPLRLAASAARRARCAAEALSTARCGRFLLSCDPAASAKALEEFLAAS